MHPEGGQRPMSSNKSGGPRGQQNNQATGSRAPATGARANLDATVAEIVRVKQCLAKLGANVRVQDGDLVSRGKPGHEQSQEVQQLLTELRRHYQQDPATVTR